MIGEFKRRLNGPPLLRLNVSESDTYNTRMNDRPGAAPKALPFDLESIDYRSLPGQTSLFLDHLHQSRNIAPFYPTLSTEPQDLTETVLRRYSCDRDRLCDALHDQNTDFMAGERALRNVERLRSESCVAVMTGQQAGLFTGPAYTIYKAVSAVLLASELEAKGLEAVPVFWIASEDHDLEEVASTTLVGRDGESKRIEVVTGGEAVGKAVGEVVLGDAIGRSITQLEAVLPEGALSLELVELVRSCYLPGASLADGFGRMMASLFREHGLIFVSPLDPRLRELSLPLVERAVSGAEEIRRRLVERDAALSNAGYHSQVKVGPDFFPFFYLKRDGLRMPLRLADGRVFSPDSDESFTVSEIQDRVRERPEMLSPNALMRPVIQDFLFPNVCYFGGSAEIAYFAQNSAIYEFLERPVTPIRHRAAFTMVEPKNRRTLEAYSLVLNDLFKGREAAEAKIVERVLRPGTVTLFDKTEKEVGELVDRLKGELAQSDPTLAESLDRRKKKMLWHLTHLRKKFLVSEAVKDDVAETRLRYLFASLLPGDALQERSLNILHFLSRYGRETVRWVFEAASPDQRDHRVLKL